MRDGTVCEPNVLQSFVYTGEVGAAFTPGFFLSASREWMYEVFASGGWRYSQSSVSGLVVRAHMDYGIGPFGTVGR